MASDSELSEDEMMEEYPEDMENFLLEQEERVDSPNECNTDQMDSSPTKELTDDDVSNAVRGHERVEPTNAELENLVGE